MIKIETKSFAGGAKLTDGTLADAVRALAQNFAKTAAAALGDLTDNSGGAAADGTVGAIPLATTAPGAGDTCPTKAEVETALGTVKNALTEIGAQIGVVAAAVPAFTPTNNIGGTAADGTIAAVTVAFTGAAGTGGTCVLRTGFNTIVTDIIGRIIQLGSDINELCVATAETPLDLSALTAAYEATDYDHIYDVISTATGTSPADGTGSITDGEGEATMAALAAAVKELATALNSITGAGTPAVEVIAA